MKNVLIILIIFFVSFPKMLPAQDIFFNCGDLVESRICDLTTEVLNDFFLSFNAKQAEEVRLVYLADPPVNQFTEFWRGRRAEENLSKQQFYQSLDRYKKEKLSNGWRWELEYVHHYIFRDAGDLISAQFHSLGIIEQIDPNGISRGRYIIEIEGLVRSANDYQILSIKQGSIDDFSSRTALEVTYAQNEIFRRDRRSSGMSIGLLAGASVMELEHWDTDFSPNEMFAGLSFEWFPNNGSIGVSAAARYHRADYEFATKQYEHNFSSRQDVQIINVSNSLGENINTGNQEWKYRADAYRLESSQSLIAVPVGVNYRLVQSEKFSLILGLHYTFQLRNITVNREIISNASIALQVEGKAYHSDQYDNQLLPIIGNFGDLSLDDRMETWSDPTHWVGGAISLRYSFGDHVALALNMGAEFDLEVLSGKSEKEYERLSMDYHASGQSGKIDFPLRSQFYNSRRYMVSLGIHYFL